VPFIKFNPDNRIEEAKENETVLDTAIRVDIPLTHVCMGNARCSTCRIQILKGLENVKPRTPLEQSIASHMTFPGDIRLACQARISGDVEVRRLVLDDDDVNVTSLLIQDSETNLIGIEKYVLILIADIRKFTSLAESLLPYDTVHILNRYFYSMSEVITRYGGRIDNFVGDGLIAVFEITEKQRDVMTAIRAGLEMLETVNKKINPYMKKLFDREISICIGLHTGLVVAGSIGGRDNKRHTIIGDAVNFTSRIEDANKELNTQFLISEKVYRSVQDLIKIGKEYSINIRGKEGLYTLYEVLGIV
jgi:adenylate cyclase